MSFEVKGFIKGIGPVEQITDAFKKRIVVVETDEKYNNTYYFTVTGNNNRDNTGLFDQFQTGEEVKVLFDINCRTFKSKASEGKKFSITELVAWKVEPMTAPAPTQEQATADAEQDDDLPF